MKRTIYTIALLGMAISASAQKLPSKVTITLTDRQVMRMDSAIGAGSNWTDSKQATQWFGNSFAPFYDQVRKQMIVDSVKVKKP